MASGPELSLQATVSMGEDSAIVETRFTVSGGFQLSRVKEALGHHLIKDLQEEERKLPPTHAPVKLSSGEEWLQRLRETFSAMANSTTPHGYIAGAMELVDAGAAFIHKEGA
jgi:hypothetical protein